MNKEELNEDTAKVLKLMFVSQVSINIIDELHDTNFYKQEFKQKTNQYLKFLEKFIDSIHTNIDDKKELEVYVEITNHLEEIINKIEL